MGIFAQVLQEILIDYRDRGYPYLHEQAPRSDPIWYPLRRLAIAPEVINRLKQAAISDEKRATLNPGDLDYLIEQLHLRPEESAKLRAALLAQGVEIFLRDRMTEDETGTIVEITKVIYDRLLGSFEDVYEKVRGVDMNTDTLGRDAAIEVALVLADRVGMMVMAMDAARARNAVSEEHFWRRVALAGYREIITLIAPVEPALATVFQEALTQLQAR